MEEGNIGRNDKKDRTNGHGVGIFDPLTRSINPFYSCEDELFSLFVLLSQRTDIHDRSTRDPIGSLISLVSLRD